jgi:superfamily II DNA/RNA helicase
MISKIIVFHWRTRLKLRANVFCTSTQPLPFGRLEATENVIPRPPVRDGRSSSFIRFDLLPAIQLAIANAGILVPTPAQLYGIPKLMSGENLLLISQTGRGKTLAYLIPLVDKLLRTNEDMLFPQPNKPRAVVVVPTRELAMQTLAVVRNVFGANVVSLGLAPGLLSFVKEKRILATSGADLIVTTPSRLQLHMKKPDGLKLSAVHSFVFDEADTLCDSVYEAEIRSILNRLLSKNNNCQVAIVGATKTAAVNSFLASVSGLNISPVLTEDAHMLVPHLDQVFVPVGRRKRTSCLSEVLAENSSPGFKTLIFTNSVRTCNFLSRFLKESGTIESPIAAFHGEMPYKIRSANYKLFTDPKSLCNVMVCTNLASRGIDLDCVNHVVMYDFPHTLADYIHRAGRTARAGRLGKVTALFTKRDIPLARKIEEASKTGKPIDYKHAVQTKRRTTQLDKYKAALSEMKAKRRGSNIKSLRHSMGLPPNLGIGNVQRKAVAKQWKEEERGKKELAFLQKRKRLSKKDKLPQLPNKVIETSETKSASKVIKNPDTGELQLVSIPRSVHANAPSRRKFS